MRDATAEAWTPSDQTALAEETTASYTYDVGNRLQSVSMAGATDPQQARYFNYDQRGFLQNEQHPEIGSSGSASPITASTTLAATPGGA